MRFVTASDTWCGLGVRLDRVKLSGIESASQARGHQAFPIVLSGIVYDVAIQLRAHSDTGFSSVFIRGIPSFDKAKNGKLKES